MASGGTQERKGFWTKAKLITDYDYNKLLIRTENPKVMVYTSFKLPRIFLKRMKENLA